MPFPDTSNLAQVYAMYRANRAHEPVDAVAAGQSWPLPGHQKKTLALYAIKIVQSEGARTLAMFVLFQRQLAWMNVPIPVRAFVATVCPASGARTDVVRASSVCVCMCVRTVCGRGMQKHI